MLPHGCMKGKQLLGLKPYARYSKGTRGMSPNASIIYCIHGYALSIFCQSCPNASFMDCIHGTSMAHRRFSLAPHAKKPSFLKIILFFTYKTNTKLVFTKNNA